MGFSKAIIGGVMGAAMSIPTYTESRKEGHGVGYSAGKMALEFMLWDSPLAPIMMGIQGAQLAASLGETAAVIGKQTATTMAQAYRGGFAYNFQDSNNAYTMRQRGIQAIEKSRMNARNALASEARTYYRNVQTW